MRRHLPSILLMVPLLYMAYAAGVGASTLWNAHQHFAAMEFLVGALLMLLVLLAMSSVLGDIWERETIAKRQPKRSFQVSPDCWDDEEESDAVAGEIAAKIFDSHAPTARETNATT